MNGPMTVGGDRGAGPVGVLVLAAILTLLGAAKPLHVDDPVYWAYAAEFARHPLRPYSFETADAAPVPANELLVPPVLPYWGALGMAAFGERPWLLKLWLLPFALLLVGSLARLSRRFAPGVAGPLLALAVLSPGLLPGVNWMLEMPTLGLSLAAVAVGLAACDRPSWRLAVAAGLLAGLAMQTKYTAFVVVALLPLWGVLTGRARHGLLMAGLAVAVFVGWELFVAAQHGQSHFLIHVGQRRGGLLQRAAHLVLPLWTQVGGLAPAVGLLGLAALGWRPRRLAALAGAVALGYLALALVPESWAVYVRDAGNHKPRFTLYQVVYALLGLLVWGALAGVARRLLTARDDADRRGRADWFLVLWFVVEVAAYFALSPFPAARRVYGVVLVGALLAGRLAARTCSAPERLAVVRWLACAGITLGLGFAAVDLLEALAVQRAAQRLARRAPALAPGRTVRHLSWHGFGPHADRAGVAALVFGRSPLRAGDVIAVSDHPELAALLRAREGHRIEPMGVLTVDDGVPVRTFPCYYAGRTPMERREGPRVTVRLFRVTDAAR